MKTFIEDCSENFPFELMSKDDVIKKLEYIAYEGRFNEDKDSDRSKLFQRYLTLAGYKPLVESLFKGEKSNQMQMIKMFDDAVMFVSMGYEFIKKTVPFTAAVRAFVRIKLCNKEGKKMFAINEFGISKKSVGTV